MAGPPPVPPPELRKENIEHLDFDLDEENKKDPNRNHYKHPIDPCLRWCGERGDRASFQSTDSGHIFSRFDQITCVGCLHQYIAKGGNWWWQVHNLYYGSRCEPDTGHTCGV